MKILMVCLGNICRSPLAEGIMKHKAELQDLGWEIDSAGTGAWHIGELPDSRSIAVAKKYGLDIRDQRARKFRAADLEEFDLVLAMDQSNYSDILAQANTKEQEDKVEMILNISDPGSNRSVPDPYWNDNGFEQVYQMLEEACEEIIRRNAKA